MESERENLVTAASLKMRAEIYSYEADFFRGLLHNDIYLEKPYAFTSFLQMIERMEEVFDTTGFPEAFMTPRAFNDEKRKKNKRELDVNADMSESFNMKSLSDSGNPRCTFEINVRFRQNATWQGQILWVEKNQRQNFRSVLEMIKLMDEALTDQEELQEPLWDTEE
ncbi:MAG: hypothetical protein FWG88_08720 [Oscillospiraceae bacterium]|nr:hypothetical protein [Oscillospiraceae bacterium]